MLVCEHLGTHIPEQGPNGLQKLDDHGLLRDKRQVGPMEQRLELRLTPGDTLGVSTFQSRHRYEDEATKQHLEFRTETPEKRCSARDVSQLPTSSLTHTILHGIPS